MGHRVRGPRTVPRSTRDARSPLEHSHAPCCHPGAGDAQTPLARVASGGRQCVRPEIVKVTSIGGSIAVMNTADLGLPVAVPSTALFTDQYELTMLQAALRA